MKSFQEIYTEIQDISGDSSTAYLTKFKRWINDTQRMALAEGKFSFLETTRDITTTASGASYELDQDVRKLIAVTTTPDSDTTIYNPEPVDDIDFWNALQALNASASDVTEYWRVQDNNLVIWPKYATASKTIHTRFRKRVVDMTKVDYTTGTITSITNGATALVGASTSWTSRKPVGEQWIKIDQSTGDGRWYKVASIDSDTTITLEKNYLGATISAGSVTYTLAEFPTIPPEYQMILVHRPLAIYYDTIENTKMSERHWRLYDGGKEIGLTKRVGGLLGKMIEEDSGVSESGYYPPQGSSQLLDPEERSRGSTFTLG